MNNNIKGTIIGWLIATITGLGAEAQVMEKESPKAERKETQEIIIRKKDGKDTKLTLEITSDKVIINGKPIAEFNEEGITINNRKIIVRDGNNLTINLGSEGKNLEKSLKNYEQRLKEYQNNFDKKGNRIENMDFNIDDDEMSFKGNLKYFTYLGVVSEENIEGAKINSVVDNSPAQKAGLQKGDIIYKIDNEKIVNPVTLAETIRKKKAGDNVKIYILRDKKNKDFKITLAENKEFMGNFRQFSINDGKGSVKTLTIPLPPMPPAPPSFEQGWDKNFDQTLFQPNRPKLGLKIQDTEEGNAVKILDVETASAAATAGLQKEDLITEIEGIKVQNTDEARDQFQANKEKSSYTVRAKRNGTEMNFTIKIPKKLKTANL